jgi:hypothetical protein
MTQVPISATHTILSDVDSRTLSPAARSYFRSRLRSRLYNLIMSKFRSAPDLTKAELGRRVGKRPEVITRLLGAPGNWTLETVSDLLMGIAGEELMAETASPLTGADRNYSYDDYPPSPLSRQETPKQRPWPPTANPLGGRGREANRTGLGV